LDAQVEVPSANGPTVVMPSVSVPAMHGMTVIERGGEDATTNNTTDNTDENTADYGRSSRLPTTVGVSILLAVIAGTALVLINLGHSGDPLAPTAMPTMQATTSRPTPQLSHSPAPSHRASPSVPPSHAATPTPSHTVTASQSATRAPGAGPAGSSAGFTTIYWTNDPEPVVFDMQMRLSRLGYLEITRDGSHYATTQQTFDDVQWQAVPDGVGYYQNATDSAIRAFEFDYLQHRQGQLPGGGCSSQTYRALVQATS
jgi:hypothetical protein